MKKALKLAVFLFIALECLNAYAIPPDELRKNGIAYIYDDAAGELHRSLNLDMDGARGMYKKAMYCDGLYIACTAGVANACEFGWTRGTTVDQFSCKSTLPQYYPICFNDFHTLEAGFEVECTAERFTFKFLDKKL